jgi:hypothetical protein
MKPELSNNEITYLNKLLSTIGYEETFRIEEKLSITYLNHRIQGKDISDKIEQFLINNKFAKFSEYPFDEIRLTKIGRIIKAYRHFYTFIESSTIPQEDIITHVEDFIKTIPMYGPYVSKTQFPVFVDNEYSVSVIKWHKMAVIYGAVTKYLVDNGFAIYRHDIKEKRLKYIQLTDSGRKLKELNSVKAYYAHVFSESEKENSRKRREAQLYWINFWIAVGAIATILFYVLEILRVQYHLGLPYHVNF